MKVVLVKYFGLEDIFYTKLQKVCEFNNYEEVGEYLKNEEKKAKEAGKSTLSTLDKKRKYYNLEVIDEQNEYLSYKMKAETKLFFDDMLSKKCC